MGPQNLCDAAQAERFVKIVGAAGPKRPTDQQNKGPKDTGITGRLIEGTKGYEFLALTGFFIIGNKFVSSLCMGPQNLCDAAQAERFVKIVGAAGPKRPKDQGTKGPRE